MRARWLALGVLGVALLFPFKAWWTLTLGVLLLVAFVAVGAATIASPEFLRADADEDDPPT